MIVKNSNFKNNYKNIIFDFDGTINNTAPGIFATFKTVLDKMGVSYDGVDFNRHIGPPLEFSYNELVGKERMYEAIALHKKVFDETNAMYNSFLYDGIVDVLNSLKKHGYKLSLASSKYEEHCYSSLKFLGIYDIFDCVYAQNENRGFKSEILRQLIDDNGWDRKDCLMIGDTLYDINGARENGIDVVAVTYGFQSREKLINAKPDAMVDSAKEIEYLLVKNEKELQRLC